MTKLVTVAGATGVQGGSVVSALLKANESSPNQFRVRAITRNTSSESAKRLSSRGVEVVQANLDDDSSLKEALNGSDVVFAVTNYWEKMSKSGEIDQGKRIADISKKVGVKHLIWSALPYVTKLTNGSLTEVQHFDSKAEVALYIESSKGNMVATYLMPGFYMQNIKRMIGLDNNGTPIFTVPWDGDKTNVPLFDAATDMGTFVVGILSQDPKTVNGLYVQGCSQWLTPNQMVQIINEESDAGLKFHGVDANTFHNALPPQIADEMMENQVLVRDYSYFGIEGPKIQDKSDKLLGNSKTVAWRDFVRANGPWKWTSTTPALYTKL
jgi:uncharacterized protein YbjT (DUF2867 family)